MSVPAGIPESEDTTANEQVIDTPQETQGQETSNGHPAWGEILEAIPTSLHGIVEPHLKKWDENVSQRFATVQSQYDPYKPFIENKVDPQLIDGSLKLWNMMQQNPRQIFDALNEQYGAEWGLNSGQGQSTEDVGQELQPEEGQTQFDLSKAPEFQQLAQGQKAIVDFFQKQIENEQRAKIDQEIDSQFKTVGEKYGELSPEDVNTIVAIATSQNKTVVEAADSFMPRVRAAQSTAQQQQSLPNVMPTGGGLPSDITDPAKLDRKGTRDLVMNILKANKSSE